MSSKSTYRRLQLTLLFIISFSFIGLSQSGSNSFGTWTIFPMFKQLFPRVVATNTAMVRIQGSYPVGASSGKLEVTADMNNDDSYGTEPASNTTTYTIISSSSDPRNFDFSVPITAGLYTYRFKLLNGFNTVVEQTNIVAGDAYYIQGQSNAEAKPQSGDANIANNEAGVQGSIPGTSGGARKFIRVYGGGSSSSPAWNFGDANKDYNEEFNLGQFGMRVGERIVREIGVPVAIMNGAELGNPIRYFQKAYTLEVDVNGRNNYARELKRLTDAGLNNHIRAVIWFQGESNTYEDNDPMHPVKRGQILTTQQYIDEFNALYTSWDNDLGLADRFYIIQIRPGCFPDPNNSVPSIWETPASVLAIQDAQRRLDENNTRVSIVSTNNLPKSSDNCHYSYTTGYKRIGDRLFTLIKRDFYGVAPVANELTPFPATVEFSARVGITQEATQLALHFSQPFDNYAIVGDIRGNFKLEGGSYNITTATIVTDPISSEKYLTLDFTKNSGTTTNPTGLTYFSNSSGSSVTPALANDGGTGIGLISFSNIPLTIGILPVDPLNLRISANTGANNLQWEADNNPQFSYFIVERGDNGSSFSEIAKVTANSANGLGNYEYTDSKPNTVRNYYRIKAFKKDGKSLYSQVVAVNNRTSSAIGITVYPNPVTDRANVGVKVKKAGAATIQIYDGAGKMVSTRKINLQKGNNMFSAGEILDQSAGIYTIRVVTEEEVFNARIVRVK